MTKRCSDPQWVGMCKGERPIGAAKGKPTKTMASCQPPPPPARHRTQEPTSLCTEHPPPPL